MPLKNELQSVVKGEVLDNEEDIKKYSQDASLLEVRPEIIVFPKDAEDVKNIVRFVSKNNKKYPNLSITARSGGTDMTGGPLNESIIVDFTKHFNRVKNISVDGKYATVQPGVFYRDFEKETLKKGLLLPSFPASREICTVGGMAANNSGGEKTLKYGKTKDYIKELKAVFSDGNEYVIKPLSKLELDKKIKQKNFEGRVYKKTFELIDKNKSLLKKVRPEVSKNSAGYNLWDAWDGEVFDLIQPIVGSQGTLCLVTEIKYKLVEAKPLSGMVVIFMKDQKFLAELINKVLEFQPTSFESFDDKTLKLALKFFFSFVKLMGTNIFSLAFRFLPEFWLLIKGGLPKLVMLVEFEGDSDKEIKERAKKLNEALKEFDVRSRITKDDKDAQKYRLIRRESFNLLRNKIKGKQTAPFIDDLIVKPSFLPEFLPALNKILNKYDLIYTIAGHMGDGNFHIIPLMELGKESDREKIVPLMNEVYDLVIKFKGSITAEHNDGLIRTPYLEKMYGRKAYGLFKKLKNIFDPQNIFNPNKKVGATLDYVVAHFKHGE